MDTNTLHRLIRSFLEEDIGRGDITSEAIFPATQAGKAEFIARAPFICSGVEKIAAEVFHVQNSTIKTTCFVQDGQQVETGQCLMQIEGPVVDMLKAERVALNLLQRLVGIATLTAQYVSLVQHTKAQITDTRKTTPGLRLIEKYGVLCGGGSNHRFNLSDGILIKDNHIAACGSIRKAVELTRSKTPHTIRIEVETDTLEQVKECVSCGVDIIMLDNMSLDTMRHAIDIIEDTALIEASGGVNLKTVKPIAELGVDIISIGGLTHSAPSCDIGMDWKDGEFFQDISTK